MQSTKWLLRTGWPATPETPENPGKTLKWLIPLERSLKYPENCDGPWKNMEKCSRKSVFSLKWLFRWPYLQFWFLNFRLRRAIIIIVYCFTHLFFPFSLFVIIQVNSHSPSASRTLEKSSIDTEIAYYQLLNCL